MTDKKTGKTSEEHEMIGDFVVEHGDMNVEAHEKTFEGFMKFVTYAGIGIIIFLIFLAMVGA